MLSLAERHKDRANRLAMNRAERNVTGANGSAVSLGSVALAYGQFVGLREKLDEKSLAELNANLEGIEANVKTARSLAEAPDGSGDTMAGIGVINPAVVPSKVGKVEALPEAELNEGDNLNGAALVEQNGDAGGWGTQTPTTRPPEEANGGNGGNGGGTQ